MNAERLLAHYGQIADAPDAIARLRRFILDLAVCAASLCRRMQRTIESAGRNCWEVDREGEGAVGEGRRDQEVEG